ncbi:ABC transporter permease subunit [Actinocorallia longicatena]|uniref:Sugar ABC transporter permease n=1 Tax=Actinocorallia longicatena TaxID=111803 RepID=A0ABP6Q679_9ACTN
MTTAPATTKSSARPAASRGRAGLLRAGFLLPALVLLGLLVVYPIGYTLWRSLFDADGSGFVGLGNYQEMFTDDATFRSLKNNVIWVIAAPSIITALGLIFAVLTERVRWGTAFKTIMFMPMAISMVAAGVIFTLVYDHAPEKGVLNAIVVGVHDTWGPPSAYPGARPRENGPVKAAAGGVEAPGTAGTPALVPLVAVPPDVQAKLQPAKAAPAAPGKITGTVWVDFSQGGGGKAGQIDPGEKGLKGITVQAVKDGKVVGSGKTGADGTFTVDGVEGAATLRLPPSNFQARYGGVDWLGPSLITPAIIGAYVWMWAGFAMVLIGAGLAAIDRDVQEAARTDGASEWQVFRKITVPMLAPVLIVVVVTLVINVLKIFDLVYIIAPGPVQEDASVLALQMYIRSYGGADSDQGLGSAIAIFLFLLVLPAMIINIRRFRRENQ